MVEQEKMNQDALHKTRWQEFWGVFRKNKLALVGMIILILFFLTAIIGGFLTHGRAPFLDPGKVRLPDKLKPPLSKPNTELLPSQDLPRLGIYLLGTDSLGRDVFARILQGARISLLVGFVAVGISVFIGMVLGGIAGFLGRVSIKFGGVLLLIMVIAGFVSYGAGKICLACILWAAGLGIPGIWKWSNSSSRDLARCCQEYLFFKLFSVDTLIMRAVDIMMCFPVFFLILTLIAILPSSIWIIMIVIGLTGWAGTTRFVRAEFLSLREQDFVIAAQALGLPRWRIIFRHMMPNAIAPVLVSATIGIPGAILTESALSFLGFGVPPPNATWGNILAGGRQFIFDAPWLLIAPAAAILVTVLSFNLFGEGLRDALNPRLRGR